MMASVALLALIGVVCLWLVVEPLVRATPGDPDATRREELLAQRDGLYAELQLLQDESRRPDLERRAALTLRALDTLPPAMQGQASRTRIQALVALGVASLLTVAGALTFLPRWQLASLSPQEAADVQAVLSLPSLKARAERTKTSPDYMAWGKAAFESANYDQALTAYGNALKLDPRQPEALRRLGILVLTRGDQNGQPLSQTDAEKAAMLIRTAAQLAPNEPESQLMLGFALSRFGQDKEALVALERYRTLNPKGRDADELITSIRAQQIGGDPAMRVYAASCASCHGPMGGGGIGANLTKSNLTREAMQGLILSGKGLMPAFEGKLSAQDMKLLLDLLEKWQKAPQ